MRGWIIAYSVIAIWTFGWLSGRFGLLPSFFPALMLFIPAVFAWRMLASRRTIKRREYAYLGLVTMLALSGTPFVIAKWYDTGVDRLAVFDRQYHQFRNRVKSMPEYENVEVSYEHGKGGSVFCVYLDGSVANKGSHDRLLQMIGRMVRNNDCWYYDRLEYPGESTATDVELAAPDGGEQADEREPQ